MGAHRKLDAIAVEQIVVERGIGRSFRQIGAALGVSHSTVSRRVRSDPYLQARIAAAEKHEARLARDRERKAHAKARRAAGPGHSTPPAQEQPGVNSGRPHGRRDQLRTACRIIRDLHASYDTREAALETLLELLEATRSNGRPAYSLQLAAAKAIMENPAATEAFAPPTRSSPRRGTDPEQRRAWRRLPGR